MADKFHPDGKDPRYQSRGDGMKIEGDNTMDFGGRIFTNKDPLLTKMEEFLGALVMKNLTEKQIQAAQECGITILEENVVLHDASEIDAYCKNNFGDTDLLVDYDYPPFVVIRKPMLAAYILIKTGENTYAVLATSTEEKDHWGVRMLFRAKLSANL